MRSMPAISYVKELCILPRLFDSYFFFIQILSGQIPPCPPRPDFDASREKLQKLGEGEGNMTREEFNKMKQELEA